MSRFERPSGAIEDANSLKVGEKLWHVYGIWPPQMGTPETVKRTAAPFREHPDFNGGSLGNHLAFDTNVEDRTYTRLHFASDGNMEPGRSHNDNYWFRSEDEARAAVTYLREQWEADPDKIAQEIERRELDRLIEDDHYEPPPYERAAE